MNSADQVGYAGFPLLPKCKVWKVESTQRTFPRKGNIRVKCVKVLENDMIAKCESVQGQRTQLSEFLLQNDRHNREQTWQFSNVVYEIHLSS